jgi:3-deoxy-manno-octulosonate cytidylyltransferase (CMP-KDO synthetase)
MNKEFNMDILGVIPARYNSSRFMGKPLVDIYGKPMIWWVYNQVKKVKEISNVIVATDDVSIERACLDLNLNVIMTSDKHKTGTDRVAEVAERIKADLYINIQGDEPLIEPNIIKKAILPLYSDTVKVTNLITEIKNPVEVVNNTIIKVVVNENNEGVYLSRSAIPYPKGSIKGRYFKQVCVYGFKPEALECFRNAERGINETIEDIEILRFIENKYPVYYVNVESNSIAVDTLNDLYKVREVLGGYND